jgi:rhodanese-related sulfurtransferase
VIVCSAGYASSLAAETLADMGFEHAADLAGGYRAWAEWAGRPCPP